MLGRSVLFQGIGSEIDSQSEIGERWLIGGDRTGFCGVP